MSETVLFQTIQDRTVGGLIFMVDMFSPPKFNVKEVLYLEKGRIGTWGQVVNGWIKQMNEANEWRI